MPSTDARLRKLYLGVLESDPTDPDPGTMWYNATTDEFRGKQGDDLVTFDTTADE